MASETKLSNEELDALCATEVMGWPVQQCGKTADLPRPHVLRSEDGSKSTVIKELFRSWTPSTDANAAREVEAEVERRGLHDEYGRQLADIALGSRFAYDRVHDTLEVEPTDLTAIATASPRSRCLAALRAVKGGE